MASSSSTSPQAIVEYGPFSGIEHQHPWKKSSASPRLFHVFINHRGPDVKDTLALQLYNSIHKMGFRPFLDSQELELGDSIPSALKNAIYSASVHIAIFSKGYAQSAWCLAELVLMLQTGVKIIPVFYDVAPSDLRYVEKGVYADAFATYKEKGRYLNKLEEWKNSLHSVSFISGYEFNKHNIDHDKLCEIVISAVLKEVERTTPLNVAKHSVGLDEIVEDFERQCGHHKGKQNVQIIGIYGMGGSGKTTLAKEIFNRKRSEYDGSSFLFDVREASAKSELPCLQTKLLKDLFKEDRPKFQSTDEGISYLRYHLARCLFFRFLIVLDDINHIDQLDALLVTDRLNSGSLVIVTTRDERVLMRAAITLRYKMKEMNQVNSRELFCWHAFCQPYPSRGYEDLVESFVKECGGLPLSLKVLGGHVSGSTDKQYWWLELDKVRNTLPEDIKQRLKISYDALDREQKEIFMDIACFFIGKLKSTAIRIWEGSGWKAEHALQTLKDKCLVVEVEAEMIYWEDKWLMMNKPHLAFTMHDHIRDLGREMADEQSCPSRLWCPQDLKPLELKGFQNILTESNGRSFRCFHSFFESSLGGRITFFVGNLDINHAETTALLSLELYLREHQLISIPSWVPLQNLQRLRIVFGCLKRLWQTNIQAPFQLKELVLQQISLEEFESSLEMLNHLEDLVIKGKTGQCNNSMLIEGTSLSETLRKLTKLRNLILYNLRLSGQLALSNSEGSTTFESPASSLQTIKICDLQLASKVLVSGERCPRLESLHLESMHNLIEVNLTCVKTLNSLMLMSCRELKKITGSFHLAAKLAVLIIKDCPQLQELPDLSGLCCLEKIIIDGCRNLLNIEGIDDLKVLKYLHLSRGGGLSKVSVGREHCPDLEFLHLESMKNLIEVDLTLAKTLNSLTLKACGDLKLVSGSFDVAAKLAVLSIHECYQLKEFPSLVGLSFLERIIINGCSFLKNIKVVVLEGLKYLHISGIGGALFKVRVTGKHCPSLESLHLESLNNLIQVDLTLVKMLNSLTLRSCIKLRTISGSFDLPAKLAVLNIHDCQQLEVLPSLAGLSCLERISISECKNLQNIKGIDELVGLKSLHLSGGGYLSNVPVSSPILESLHLESIKNLIGVDLRRVKALNSLTVKYCTILRTISGSFVMAPKFSKIIIEDCPQLVELPSLAGLSCLETIIINRCLNLQNIDGIDKLEGLKYLHLSGGGVSKVSVSGEHCHSLETVYLESMENLIAVDLTRAKTLNSLTLRSCRKLKAISVCFDLAAKLAILNIRECPELEELQILSGQCRLERMVLDGCWKLQHFTGIEEFEGLKYLHLSGGYKAIQNCIPRFQRLPSEVTTVIGEAAHEYWRTDISKLFTSMVGPDAVSEIGKYIARNSTVRNPAPTPTPDSVPDTYADRLPYCFYDSVWSDRMFAILLNSNLNPNLESEFQSASESQFDPEPEAAPEPEANPDPDLLSFDDYEAVPLKCQRKLSAVIVCAVVESFPSFGKIKIPFPLNDSIQTQVEGGKWIVTIVITGQSDIQHAQQDISKWIPKVLSGAKLKGGCIVTMNKRKESKALEILKTIVNTLYKVME